MYLLQHRPVVVSRVVLAMNSIHICHAQLSYGALIVRPPTAEVDVDYFVFSVGLSLSLSVVFLNEQDLCKHVHTKSDQLSLSHFGSVVFFSF